MGQNTFSKGLLAGGIAVRAGVERDEALGEALRAARRRHFPRDTQQDFARRIGVGRVTYHKMEQGDLSPGMRAYWAAFSRLGCREAVVESVQDSGGSLLDLLNQGMRSSLDDA